MCSEIQNFFSILLAMILQTFANMPLIYEINLQIYASSLQKCFLQNISKKHNHKNKNDKKNHIFARFEFFLSQLKMEENLSTMIFFHKICLE